MCLSGLSEWQYNYIIVELRDYFRLISENKSHYEFDVKKGSANGVNFTFGCLMLSRSIPRTIFYIDIILKK